MLTQMRHQRLRHGLRLGYAARRAVALRPRLCSPTKVLVDTQAASPARLAAACGAFDDTLHAAPWSPIGGWQAPATAGARCAPAKLNVAMAVPWQRPSPMAFRRLSHGTAATIRHINGYRGTTRKATVTPAAPSQKCKKKATVKEQFPPISSACLDVDPPRSVGKALFGQKRRKCSSP